MARSSGRTNRRPARGKKGGPAGEPDDHALGRSQGGFGTKLHLICDAAGTPLAVAVSPGQAHETQSFVRLLEDATLGDPELRQLEDEILERQRFASASRCGITRAARRR